MVGSIAGAIGHLEPLQVEPTAGITAVVVVALIGAVAFMIYLAFGTQGRQSTADAGADSTVQSPDESGADAMQADGDEPETPRE
ncbi:hypothetical protein [Halopiger djelfimassiliensis]|uniref:hypothetical protein n=1 Tax=Halopiger djelfimassiliensis TaxID=1293047 RepID=UPI0006781315|nr:hypothetical protein [Halopiger djelfimassiliensis]